MGMIKRSEQNWATGQTVKVGFMSLVVVQAIPTPGDFLPDAYLLSNHASTKLYKFVPHNGLTAVSVDEANELIASGAAHARQQAIEAIARAKAPGHRASIVLGH